MNRHDEIDNFIRYMAKVYYQNPQIEINDDTLYSMLMNYHVPENEIRQDQTDKFQKWISHFSKSKNLNVYRDERQWSFLQFMSKGNVNVRDNAVKLYLTFSPNTIEPCVNRIFDFIEKHKMPTRSKVANTVRTDSVVLRMFNPEDAKKVIEFISNDRYLKSNLRDVNPFLINENGIGMACDDLMSFNSVVSELLTEFLKLSREYNQLAHASLETFTHYIEQVYQTTFIDLSNFKNFADAKLAKGKRIAHENAGDFITNYKNILELFMMSLNKNSNKNMFFEFFDNVRNKDMLNSSKAFYNQLYMMEFTENYEHSCVNLFDSFIKYAFEKYKSTDAIINGINRYVQTNDLSIITRDNGFRVLFERYLPRETLLQITNGNISGYINNKLNLMSGPKTIRLEEENPTLKIENPNEEAFYKQILDSYIMYAAEKYHSVDFVIPQLLGYVNNNNEKAITRDNNFRELFTRYLEPSVIIKLTNGNIKGYVESFRNYNNATYISNRR